MYTNKKIVFLLSATFLFCATAVLAQTYTAPSPADLIPPTDKSKIIVIPPYTGGDKRPEPVQMIITGDGKDAVPVPPKASGKSISDLPPADQQKIKDALADSPFSSGTTTPKETVSCFAYYKFNSISIDAAPVLNAVVIGSPLKFTGKIINNNDYPIVEGAVYAKIFRKQANEADWRHNAHDLVDQFFVADNLSIPAKGSKPIDFTWQIPLTSITGDYFISFYFVSSKQFNLLGLSFLDDITGSMFPFHINGEQQGTVAFNKNTVKLNGLANNIAEPHLRFKQDEPVTAKIQLVNTTKKSQTVPLHFTLFNWDGLKTENQIDTRTDMVTLKAGETKEFSYTITDTKYPVYYLVAEADFKDAKSFLDIRFVREGVDKIRINFPAVTSYPLEADKSATLFSCLHNSGSGAVVKNGKLDLTITDTAGNVVDSYTYTGDVTGAMMGVKHDFVPKEKLTDFIVNAKLYQNGILVDEATMKYDCQALNACPPIPVSGMKDTVPVSGMKDTVILLLKIFAFLFVIGFIFFALWKFRKNKSAGMVVMMLVLGGAMFGGAGNAMAGQTKSVVAGANHTYDYSCDADAGTVCDSGPLAWSNYADLMRGYSGATYYASTNYSDGATLNVGDVVTFTYESTSPTWFSTGGAWDSPYGVWHAGAAAPPVSELVGYQYLGPNLAVLGTQLSVNPPPIGIYQSGSAGLSCWGIANGVACQVTSGGTIVTQIYFGGTYGNWWYGSMYHGVIYWSWYTDNSAKITLGAAEDNFPAADIWYSMSAVQPNNPPNAPTIAEVGGNSHLTGQNQGFTFRATDPVGDQVRYLIDWNRDGTGDEWTPSYPGTVASGSSSNATHSFSAGTHTFQALTQDSKGSNSGWTSYSVTIADPPLATVSLTVAVSTLNAGNKAQLSWYNITNAPNGCVASNAQGVWSGSKTTAGGSELTGILSIVEIYTFTITCYDSAWVPASASRSVTVIPASVNGVCGNANGKNYNHDVTDYTPDVQCSSGTSSNTAFPASGATASWNCEGLYGGSSASCSASRKSTPVNGVCGSANGKTYSLTATAYAPHLQCAVGLSTNTAFPAIGETVSWQCQGENGGANPSCSAGRSANGACGKATSAPAIKKPSGTSLCVTGTPTEVTVNTERTQWLWNCGGVLGGGSTQCTTKKTVPSFREF